MVGLVRLVPAAVSPEPLRRVWLLFFSDGDRAYWWARLLRPGFRHIRAAAWFDRAERWVYFDPSGRGTHIEVATDEEFAVRFDHLLRTSTAVLQFPSAFERERTPAELFCTGSIKALLGIKSRALRPYSIFRDLLDRGAEVIKRPAEVAIGLAHTRIEAGPSIRAERSRSTSRA